jgi:cell division transport system permease protein
MTGPYRSGPLLSPEGPRAWFSWLAFGLMSFLTAALMIATLVGALMARDLTSRLTGSATVLVRSGGLESDDAAAARTAEILGSMSGVTRASVMEPNPVDGTIADLIEARAPVSTGGPTRLVTASFSGRDPREAGRIARDLMAQGLRVTVDDNHLWTSHLWRTIGIAAVVAAASWLALALVAAFTLGARSRACVNAHRDLVALLHLSGANDGYVADLFRQRLGVRAAVAAGTGALLAIAGALVWRMVAAPGVSWIALAAALPWPAIAVAAAIGAATLSTRAVLHPRP